LKVLFQTCNLLRNFNRQQEVLSRG